MHSNAISKVKESKLRYKKMINVKFYTRYLSHCRIFIDFFCHNDFLSAFLTNWFPKHKTFIESRLSLNTVAKEENMFWCSQFCRTVGWSGVKAVLYREVCIDYWLWRMYSFCPPLHTDYSMETSTWMIVLFNVY